MKRISLLLCVLCLVSLVSCGEKTSSGSKNTSSSTSHKVTTLNTNQTDVLELETSFAGLDFVESGIGEVSLLSCVDGDTASFTTQKGTPVKIRFLGIDTEESTGQIEPWGKAASYYTCSTLKSSQRIILESQVTGQSAVLDSTGSRYLGFVWYQPVGESKYRLLNLELVEQAYSKNFLYTGKYVSVFGLAAENAMYSGRRLYGELDPNFDYSGEATEVTIHELRRNYSEYGSSDVSSGKLVRVEGLVVMRSGYSVYIRDTYPTYDEATKTYEYGGIYVYGGYSTNLVDYAKLGSIVRFYCRGTEYNETIQLSDVKFTTKFKPEVVSLNNEITVFELDTSKGLDYWQGQYVTTNITITQLPKVDATKGYALKGVIEGTNQEIGIYVAGNLYPTYKKDYFELGSTYKVSGGMSKNFGSYEIAMGDNTNSNYKNVEKITKE